MESPSLRSREASSLLGPNGSGKSTTIRLMMGLLPGGGTTLFDGSRLTELKAVARQVGVMGDGITYVPRWTVADYLSLVAVSARLGKATVRRALERGELAEFGPRRMATLSLGQRQQVKLTAALLGAPSVLILDEPLNGMDVHALGPVTQQIESVARRGGTVVMTSHLLQHVEQLAHRVVVMRSGRIIADEEMGSLLSNGAHAHVRVQCTDPTRLATALESEQADVRRGEGGALAIRGLAGRDIGRIALREGILVEELVAVTPSLEETYVAMTATDSPPQVVDGRPVAPLPRSLGGDRATVVAEFLPLAAANAMINSLSGDGVSEVLLSTVTPVTGAIVFLAVVALVSTVGWLRFRRTVVASAA